MEESLGLVVNDTSTYQTNWDNKIKKLMWRGVPMVDVRQVCSMFCSLVGF